MKKSIILLTVLILFTSAVIADSDENLIIPQSDQIYEDFYFMANAGLITSATAEQIRYSPMTQYDAAKYVVEAAENLYAANSTSKSSAQAAKLRKYYDIYRKKAFEIYGKTMDMRKRLKEVELKMQSPDIASFKETIDDTHAEIFDIEGEYKNTTYRGIPPFKVQGMLTARWQDVEAFGVGKAHHTSLGGTFMQLWTEGIVSPDVSFKLNIAFEYPNDEADKKTVIGGVTVDLAEYWGTGQRFVDTYTIDLKLYDFVISTGFFWDDITTFVAKSVLSNRPALFEKDPYALEETTKGHYENAFYHSFVKRGDIWSKHGFMGIRLVNNDLFGTKMRLKIMAGKAEKFEETYDRLYLYEYAARFYAPFEFGPLYESYMAINFFNTSNEEAEIETLAEADFDSNTDVPGGYFRSNTIVGFDFKSNIFNFVELETEFEASDYHGRIPKLIYAVTGAPLFVNQYGNAFYIEAAVKQLPIPVNFEFKYTRIDPNYVAEASAVIDTAGENKKLVVGSPYPEIKWDTYAGDPTLIYNNIQRIDLFATVEIPGGFINLLYGSASQINPTSNRVFADHFVAGNRLTSPMWWNIFYSSYGYPTAREDAYLRYVAPDHWNASGSGQRYLFTTKWLTNKEMFVLYNADDPDSYTEDTYKYFNNISLELKLAVNKMLGFKNSLFFQAYGEIISVWKDQQVLPVFAGEDTLFSSQYISTFLYYGLTRKMGIMFEFSLERWAARDSVKATGIPVPKPVDYIDTSFGLGYDFDFAPRTSLHLRVKKFIHEDMYFDDYMDGTVHKTQSFDGWYMLMEVKNFF